MNRTEDIQSSLLVETSKLQPQFPQLPSVPLTFLRLPFSSLLAPDAILVLSGGKGCEQPELPGPITLMNLSVFRGCHLRYSTLLRYASLVFAWRAAIRSLCDKFFQLTVLELESLFASEELSDDDRERVDCMVPEF